MRYLITQQIANFLKYLENIQSCSPLTLKAYSLDLKQAFSDQPTTSKKNSNLIILEDRKALTFHNGDELWNLCRPGLNQWGHLSLASRNRKIASLKSFFNWLYQEKIIDRNYSDQLVCPKIPKKIPHFISVDEVLSVLNYLKEPTTKEMSQQKILFHLLYGGGLRISEACHLKWKNIHFSERRLLILGKGQKERLIILPEACIEVLKDYLNKNEKTEFVFGNVPLNTRKGYELIRQLGQKVGLMIPLHPHSLRHSFATHMLASGANLRTLQSMLGHESLQATEKYTHLNIDLLARVVEVRHPLSKKTKID